MPHNVGDLKRAPNLENYPNALRCSPITSLSAHSTWRGIPEAEDVAISTQTGRTVLLGIHCLGCRNCGCGCWGAFCSLRYGRPSMGPIFRLRPPKTSARVHGHVSMTSRKLTTPPKKKHDSSRSHVATQTASKVLRPRKLETVRSGSIQGLLSKQRRQQQQANSNNTFPESPIPLNEGIDLKS